MATGACGIDCTTCRLHLRGICSSCGGGMTPPGHRKMEAQQQLLGAPCAILACARLNRLNYCMADCDSFPCENFSSGNYPYGEAFLRMQKRRRQESAVQAETEKTILVPRPHWQSLQSKQSGTLQQHSGGYWSDDKHLILKVLNRDVRITAEQQQVEILQDGSWIPAPPFLSFVTVVYLINVGEAALSGRWVSEKDLSCASFFQGIHRLPVEKILNRFAAALDDFRKSAETLGGVATNDHGDSAVRLWVFPQIPVKLILWCEDEVLPPALTVLFDHSIDKLLPADGIWAMVGLLGDTLVEAADTEIGGQIGGQYT